MAYPMFAGRHCGSRGVTVLERLLRALRITHSDDYVPPVPMPPAVPLTPHAERKRIDDRLKGAEAHLAELATIAGLDERRTRPREHQDAQ
jgi:hypothetical protein